MGSSIIVQLLLDTPMTMENHIWGEKNILPLPPQPLDGVTIVISVPYSSESGLCGIPAAGFPVWEAD
jgi:hypothetical protein